MSELPSVELLRNVGAQLVRTKRGKCSACYCETEFNENVVGRRQFKMNLCSKCYRVKTIKDAMASIRGMRHQLVHLSKCDKALTKPLLIGPTDAFDKALYEAFQTLTKEE